MGTKWRQYTDRYWGTTSKAHEYFWHYRIFRSLTDEDPKSRFLYSIMPKIDASGPASLLRHCEKPGSDLSGLEEMARHGSATVFKLTHKWSPAQHDVEARAIRFLEQYGGD